MPYPGSTADAAEAGRALVYVAHEYMGPVFGSADDLSTIVILWFAGAYTTGVLVLMTSSTVVRWRRADPFCRLAP